jgi:hypothetical protein
MSALFLIGHCEGATRARGHEVGGQRGAWAVANQMISVGFPGRRRRAVNTPEVEYPITGQSPLATTRVVSDQTLLNSKPANGSIVG